MAGNKINTKTKGKEDKSKSNRGMTQNNEENEDADFSLLRKPIFTSITGFAQARKIFDLATEELKGLISNECDLLYECKVCRNIFRSLANFISHKRIYCTEQFNTTRHGQLFKMNSTANEMIKIKRLEEQYFESLKDKDKIEVVNTDDTDNRIPLTKDLTAIIEKIVKSKGANENISEEQQIVFQKIPNSSVAVFQNIDNDEAHDKMGTQVKELDNILSRDKAVLQSDGKFKVQSSLPRDTDNVIQISDDEDNDTSNVLKCKICDHHFSTLKTLKFHMKYKHLESRLVYSCPDCLEIFSTSWSVYRHLFKVHRKTAAQIRRLRESIQAKAFKMNNPPAFYEKRKNMKPPTTQKISEEERLDQENQAWMDNVEGDSEIPRCFGCGRTFERRAALAAHTHTCQPRSRALARRPPETKKIEIQIRKDYNKGPVPSLNVPIKTADSNNENKTTSEDIHQVTKSNQDANAQDANAQDDKKELENQTLEEMPMDTSEIMEKTEESPEKPTENRTETLSEVTKPVFKLPFAQHIEKSNLTAFKQRIQRDIEINKLLCKKCDIHYDTVQELFGHMAGHYKWMRYACKLCNFKHYDLEKLPEHVKVVHKLKGDNDFYYSTVKAIDGNEALDLSECLDESADINGASPESRRPSRCSSDSSRLSDDSSSSSTRLETGTRKRKMCQIKGAAKRKRSALTNDDDEDQKSGYLEKEANNTIENDSPSVMRAFEENSSDMDDIEEKITKRHSFENVSSVASRRPVRKKTKPKNEDFEYDLSNLLKMEAQGYRDSQSLATKSNQTKKKPYPLENSNNYENMNRDCSGALATLSKRAVEKFTAHIKNTNFISNNIPKESKPTTVFARPMLPKSLSRSDKISPKKDQVKETEDCQNVQKELKEKAMPVVDSPSLQKEVKPAKNMPDKDSLKLQTEVKPTKISPEEDSPNLQKEDNPTKNTPDKSISQTTEKDIKACPESSKSNSESTPNGETATSNNTVKPVNLPSVVPIKFRRQSLEVIKNPLINKNISDFKKAGMKTKILVIKPINRNKGGATVSNTPLKFQTIKLKDPSKSSKSNEEQSDQVVVVKMPKVDCTISLPTSERSVVANEKAIQAVKDTTNKTETSTLDPKVLNNANKQDATDDVVNEKQIVKNSDNIKDDNHKSVSNNSEVVNATEDLSDDKQQNIDSKVIEAAT